MRWHGEHQRCPHEHCYNAFPCPPSCAWLHNDLESSWIVQKVQKVATQAETCAFIANIVNQGTTLPIKISVVLHIGWCWVLMSCLHAWAHRVATLQVLSAHTGPLHSGQPWQFLPFVPCLEQPWSVSLLSSGSRCRTEGSLANLLRYASSKLALGLSAIFLTSTFRMLLKVHLQADHEMITNAGKWNSA